MIRTLKYNKLSMGSLFMYGDHVDRYSEHSVNWRKTTGKLAVVGTDENEAEINPLSILRLFQAFSRKKRKGKFTPSIQPSSFGYLLR